MTETAFAAILRAREQLIASGLATPQDVVGCSAAEIEDVQRLASARLPTAYTSFLATMGRRAGRLLEGSDFQYPEVLGLRDALVALMEEDGAGRRLAPAHFVFVGHQGYEFLLFEVGVCDDPAVLRFVEGDRGPSQVARTFSAWLAQCVEDEGRARRVT